MTHTSKEVHDLITLYEKSTNRKLALLDDILLEDSVSITRQINGECTLQFEALEADLKSEYFQSEAYVEVNGLYFDIAYVEQLHADTLTYRIECEHVTYRLLATAIPYYTYDGTPTEILTDLLSGTEFQLGQVDFTEVLTFAVYEEQSKLGLVKLLSNTLGAEISYNGLTIDLKATVGVDRGFQIRFGKNLTGIKKIIDRRSGLTHYAVDLIELKNHPAFIDVAALEVVEEGDTIRIVDDLMGLDILNKVVKRTYNPLKAINTALEIANRIELLTDTVTKIQRDTLAKGKLYHGIRISPDNGFESIRSDNLARGIFNSDTFALQSGDGTGGNWTNRLYFDTISGKYIFDGALSATLIEALEAEFDVTISYTTITNVLSAQYGNIAELTVDSLETSNKITRYYADPKDSSPMHFIRAVGNHLDFIAALVVVEGDTPQTEQLANRYGQLLYWLDEDRKGITLEETDWPVMGYKYDEQIKMRLHFDDSDPTHTPRIEMGAGDGVLQDSAKARIIKEVDGLYLRYWKSNTGDLREIGLTDAGIHITPYDLEQLDFYSTGFSARYSGTTYSWTWIKDGTGRITQLTTEDDIVIPVNWH